MSLGRRTTFGEDAELYDRARPGYPDPLFDDLVRSTNLPEGGRILEVGCGTGQATIPLARRGFRVHAVELSSTLAEVARRNFRPYPGIHVVEGAFEDFLPPADPFDLVLAASAWHWIEPTVRYRRAAEMLVPGGWLAVVQSHHITGGTTDFFEESQRCYRRFFPDSSPGYHLPRSSEVRTMGPDIEDSGWFHGAVRRTYLWERTYEKPEYLDLLRTYSDHRSLGPRRREELLACIGDLMDDRFRGEIRKAYLTELTLARRGRTNARAERLGSSGVAPGERCGPGSALPVSRSATRSK
jgi:SAM-dependent methyltransferase